jgi:23S rRNA (adenine2503-C2)-methyltransferase
MDKVSKGQTRERLQGDPPQENPLQERLPQERAPFELLAKVPDLGPFAKIGAKGDLRNIPLPSLPQVMERLREKPYRSAQVAKWLYGKAAKGFSEMTDIGLKTRESLDALYHADPALRALEIHPSPDGAARLLWGLRDGLSVESVVISERDHLTLCVSTQVGCRMGCRFCRTATLGFKRQLAQSEILGQILETRRMAKNPELITNVVLMGMGEPLDNLGGVLPSLEVMTSAMAISPKRISVSTVGVIPAIDKLAGLEKGFRCGLTISLGAPQDALRSSIMPSNRRWPLMELKKALQRFPLAKGRRLTIAYVLLAGVNDAPEQALELSRLLAGLKTKINLIPFNPWPGAPYSRPDDSVVEAFKQTLIDKNHTAIVRRSSGRAVSGACGQLVAREAASRPGPSEA